MPLGARDNLSMSPPPPARSIRRAMEAALDAASAHHPHPNPRVGAAVVAGDGTVLALAAHRAAGSPHAEALALGDAGTGARGSTLVVTLEPCTHHGRTPPCAPAVVAAGVSRVVIGAVDPDPRVSGTGIAALRAGGVEVVVGVPGVDAEAVDPGYFHHRRTGRPLLTLKLAGTLDGQAAAADGTSRWITGEEARADVHRHRAVADAVMVGAGTLRTDDPSLDARLPGHGAHQPRPVVVAGDRPLPAARRVYGRGALVYLLGRAAAPEGVEAVAASGLREVVEDLGARGVLDLLVEGGPGLARSLLDAGLVDRLVLYLGARVAGGSGRPLFDGGFATLGDAHRVTIDDATRLGADLRVTGSIRREVA